MIEQDLELQRAREDLCRFLSACYYQPVPEFAEDKLFDSMLAAASVVDPELAAGARRLGDAFAGQDLQELLIDYTRLFLGPVDAPARPYGSIWLGTESELMQESTMAVLELYREGGFDVADDFRELPDHVAAELEFLYLLIFREHRARRDGDGAAVAMLEALQRRLLGEHIGRWAKPFTAAVERHAQTAFYRELAGLTARFVAMQAGIAAASVPPARPAN